MLIGNSSVRDIALMRLLDRTWLEEETITVYLELLLREYPRFQIISSRKIAWELTALRREGGPEEGTYADFDVEDGTSCFLIPTNVNDDHWILCVAKLSRLDEHGLMERKTKHSLHFIFGSDDIDLKVERDSLDPPVDFTHQATYSNPPAI